MLSDLTIIPRCPGCGRFSTYILVNKKTGERKFFCESCGALHLLKYNNKEDWIIIHLG